MVESIIEYLSLHPIAASMVVVAAMLLAFIGLWYIVHHHLQVIVITLLCTAGVLSGGFVLYRGATNDLKDLILIGLFLLVVFPVIFYREVMMMQSATPAVPPKPEDKLHHKRILY